jgi:hypothetical protein
MTALISRREELRRHFSEYTEAHAVRSARQRFSEAMALSYLLGTVSTSTSDAPQLKMSALL